MHLIILLRKVLAVVKHPTAEMGLHLDGCAAETNAPEKASRYNGENHDHEGEADLVEQKIHGKGLFYALVQNNAIVDAVDSHAVHLGDDELHIIHQHQRQKTQQECG